MEMVLGVNGGTVCTNVFDLTMEYILMVILSSLSSLACDLTFPPVALPGVQCLAPVCHHFPNKQYLLWYFPQWPTPDCRLA